MSEVPLWKEKKKKEKKKKKKREEEAEEKGKVCQNVFPDSLLGTGIGSWSFWHRFQAKKNSCKRSTDFCLNAKAKIWP